MIQQVSHQVASTGPADLGLALAVAYELNAPAAPVRAPEVSTRAASRRSTARRRPVRA
ncbi:hypothetical protein ACIPSE_36275 [Streptomyces sp. NPDC090106]|uniref:hypothetical protein n=1 Tax=Streptomyces sp. NPDC090106 TaxID=3365946 RepID=UPI00382E8662